MSFLRRLFGQRKEKAEELKEKGKEKAAEKAEEKGKEIVTEKVKEAVTAIGKAEVYHIQGKKAVKIKSPFEFMNGDCYVVKADPKVFIWLGAKSYADDKAVAAWSAKQFDFIKPDLDIDTEVQGKESSEFKKAVGDFRVIVGDTPGFLKHIDTSPQYDYKLYHVKDVDIADGSSTDDVSISEVPISKDSLNSDDVFVLDGGMDLYVWIGKDCQVGEKAAGNRLARKLDVERKRTPMIYTVIEGEEPPGFYELLAKLSSR
ncbi:MAG: hypothetical protein ACFFDT_39770 [Candidatus Hodarchaeota archaeon]